MKVKVDNKCSDFNSYRAARVKSLFNVQSGCNFALDADLPIDGGPWRIGVVVGPSGSGKTSIGKALPGGITRLDAGWPSDAPIIDAIGTGLPFDEVTAALASVGLGSVPSWLRPFHVLSNGEQFRAGLARVLSDARDYVVIDEFTSVVDRQIAQIGAMAFSKAWRRLPDTKKAVLISCHYDILDWIQPDWVFDTQTGEFVGRWLRQRPRIELEVTQTDGSYWRLFEPHHYLKLPRMVAAEYFVGTVAGRPVAHVAVAPRLQEGRVRACRLVIMPEWQGAGIGVRFLEAVCEKYLSGDNRYKRRCRVLFHTSHPGLAAALRRGKKWVQISAALFGRNKNESARALAKSGSYRGAAYGGHMRAVQGFLYIGGAK